MKNFFTTLTVAIALVFTVQISAQDMEDTITLTSSIFEHHGMVPEENSAYGANTSIDLSWSDLPAGTQSLALIEVSRFQLLDKNKVSSLVYSFCQISDHRQCPKKEKPSSLDL